jgi:hypothetical protein
MKCSESRRMPTAGGPVVPAVGRCRRNFLCTLASGYVVCNIVHCACYVKCPASRIAVRQECARVPVSELSCFSSFVQNVYPDRTFVSLVQQTYEVMVIFSIMYIMTECSGRFWASFHEIPQKLSRNCNRINEFIIVCCSYEMNCSARLHLVSFVVTTFGPARPHNSAGHRPHGC